MKNRIQVTIKQGRREVKLTAEALVVDGELAEALPDDLTKVGGLEIFAAFAHVTAQHQPELQTR